MPTEIPFIFRKFEGYAPSGLGSRSIPVDRQAGRLAGRQTKTVLFSRFLKFVSWSSKHYLAALNNVIGLLMCCTNRVVVIFR